jgi:hypothetical protein
MAVRIWEVYKLLPETFFILQNNLVDRVKCLFLDSLASADEII